MDRTDRTDRTRLLTINSIVAALYVLLTLINPIGVGAYQFRISEALCVLPFFNRKYIGGILVGVTIANAFSPLGPIDVLMGLGSGVIAYTISKYIKNKYINCIQYSAVAAIVVSSGLHYILKVPFVFTTISIFTTVLIVTLLGVTLINKIQDRTNII